MNRQFLGEIAPDMESLSAKIEEVGLFLSQNQVPSDASYAIQLALEELVTNAFKYGFSHRAPLPVSIRLEIGETHVEMILSDAGDPFNPFDQTAPELDLPAEERPIGGLGLHFVKNMMDECHYHREGHQNILHLHKAFPTNS